MRANSGIAKSGSFKSEGKKSILSKLMTSGKSQAETPANTMEGTNEDGRPTGEERKEGDEDSGDEVQIAAGP